MHMINCQNIFAEPLDPVFIGAMILGQQDVMVKAYDSQQLTFMPSNARFVAESDTGTLEVIHIDTLTDLNKAKTMTPMNYTPRYLYLVDFIVKFEFMCSTELRKNFNYMQKYGMSDSLDISSSK